MLICSIFRCLISIPTYSKSCQICVNAVSQSVKWPAVGSVTFGKKERANTQAAVYSFPKLL